MSDMRKMRVVGLCFFMAAGLAGCTSSASREAQAPTSRLVTLPGTATPSVALTPLGAERIGLETAPVSAGPGGAAMFPYAALLYEPDGHTVVYASTGRLTYMRHFVKVDAINGGQVTVVSGVYPGQRVVTDGAEELLGIQNGVGEQT